MLNCGLRQPSFQSLPWVAQAGAEHTWHGRGTTAELQPCRDRGQTQGHEHGATKKQGGKGRKGKIGRAMEMRDCGHQVGTPITPVFGCTPA